MRFAAAIVLVFLTVANTVVRAGDYWSGSFTVLDSAATARDADLVEHLAGQMFASLTVDSTVSDSLKAAVSSEIGRRLTQVARFDSAEPYLVYALDLQRRLFGENHPDVAATLQTLSLVRLRQARLAYAESLAREALAIRESDTATTPIELAESLESLALVTRYVKGELPETEQLLDRALAIRKALPGARPIDYAGTTFALASLYRVWDQVPRADTMYRELLTLYEAEYGPEDIRTASTLGNIGNLNLYLDSLDIAEPYLRRALDIKKKILGETHPSIALLTFTLGVTLRCENRLAEADSLVQRALDIWKETSGPHHPDAAGAMEELALLRSLRGRHDESTALLAEALAIRETEFRDNYFILSERRAAGYAEKLQKAVGWYLCEYFRIEHPSEALIDSASSWVLRCKGELSEAVFARARRLHSADDPILVGLGDSLETVRQQLADVYASGFDRKEGGRFRRLDSLESLSSRLETAFARRCNVADNGTSTADWSCRAAQDYLPESTALLEYMRFRNPESETATDSIHRYAVAVVTRTGTDVIDLGPVAPIDSLVAIYRALAESSTSMVTAGDPEGSDSASAVLRALYRAVWQPCEKDIGSSATVLVAPAGRLCGVSFATLKDDDGYLIERYRLAYLGSGRELRRLSDPAILNSGLLAMGDPDFDATVPQRLAAVFMPDGEPPEPAAPAPFAMRAASNDCRNIDQIRLAPLPYTRREISSIAARWEATEPEPAHVFFRAAASEENFKRNAPGSRVIHLSTHGYFVPEECEANSIEETDPLLSSGIFLAGANLHGDGAQAAAADDGLLTALEVSCLNLAGTQTVVLSACQSGMGKVEVGEGVYGLRRAFQMAGVRTVVCALWNIPDKDAARLMTSLYDDRGAGLADSFRDVALRQINAARRAGHPEEPFKWGAFIEIGDWKR